MQHRTYKFLGIVVATVMLVVGCGGGGDDGGDGGNPGGGPVNPADPNAVMNNILVQVGGQNSVQQNGNPPAPSASPEAPDASAETDTVTTTKAANSQASVPIDFEVEGALCNVYAKVVGASSFENVDLCPGGKALKRPKFSRAKVRTRQTFVFTVKLQEDFNATSAPICFEVTGQDATGLVSNVTTICITLVTTAPENATPVADAGDDRTATQNTTVNLDGTDSFDFDGPIASYQWTQVGGSPTVTLNNANTATPSFTAPSVSELTPLTFQLTVTDTDNATDSDTVVVDVSPVDLAGGQLRFTLAWDTDLTDVDLWVREPSGNVISFESPFDCSGTLSANGGCLDVDDTNGFGPENIIYAGIPPNGTYCVAVDEFRSSDPASNFTLTGTLAGDTPIQFTGNLPAQNSGYRWFVFTVNGTDLTGRAGNANDANVCPVPGGALLP